MRGIHTDKEIAMKCQMLLSKPGMALAALLICLTLSGCGDGLSGNKYVEDGGNNAIEFKPGHKAYITAMGQTQEVTYSVDGDKITLTPDGQSNIVLTRGSDGAITGLPMCGPLKKQS
jgi:hypothetical protein